MLNCPDRIKSETIVTETQYKCTSQVLIKNSFPKIKMKGGHWMLSYRKTLEALGWDCFGDGFVLEIGFFSR